MDLTPAQRLAAEILREKIEASERKARTTRETIAHFEREVAQAEAEAEKLQAALDVLAEAIGGEGAKIEPEEGRIVREAERVRE